MPKIKWKIGAKITTLALGLDSDVKREGIPKRVNAGESIELSEAMLTALKKVHPPESFTVVAGAKPAAKAAAKGKK